MTTSPPPPFDARPWLGPAGEVPAHAARVPTMLSEEEGRLLYWLAAHYADGSGAICDLGCFAGGSTARLAAGVAVAGRATKVAAFDHFRIEESQKRRYLYPAGIVPFRGRDMLHAARQLLAPWQEIAELRRGDIHKATWRDGPIEVLFIDAAKTPSSADLIAAEFFPHLIPGRSVIVQQDYLHWRQPWIAAQMELLADSIEPVAWCRKGTVVFRVTQPLSPGRLAEALVERLTDQAILELLYRALGRFPDRPQRAQIARAILVPGDNPGARTPQRFNGAAITHDRIRAVLQEAARA